jgi:hypothetical protein
MLIGPDRDPPPRPAKRGKKAKARKDRATTSPAAEPLVPEPAPDAGTGFARPAVWPLIPEPDTAPVPTDADASSSGPPSDEPAPAGSADPTTADPTTADPTAAAASAPPADVPPADPPAAPGDVPPPSDADAPEDALVLLDRIRERVGHLIERGATSAAPAGGPAAEDAAIPDAAVPDVPAEPAPEPAGPPSAATLLARELLAGGTPPAEVARRLGEHYGVADPGAVLAGLAPATG